MKITDTETGNHIKSIDVSNVRTDFIVTKGIYDTDQPILKSISYSSDFTELDNTVTTDGNLTFTVKC